MAFRSVKAVLETRPALLAVLLAVLVFAGRPEAWGADPASPSRPALDLAGLRNPIWQRPHGVRDPAVLPVEGGYVLYYNRPEGGQWGDPNNWSICSVFTPDFRTFRDDQQITPHGYASPDVATEWHGRWILPYQRYPKKPVLCYSASPDGKTWGAPIVFLEEAVELPWNTQHRVIDPTFVVDGDTLHCFFIGSCPAPEPWRHANLLGHATTTDPELKQWTMLTPDAPLLGIGDDAPDGVENVIVFKRGDQWTMIYSEGLQKQHLAYGVSPDLVHWTWKGKIDIPVQTWMTRRYGAPFVWREPNQWLMILMGCDAQDLPQVGLLSSVDGLHWTLLPERPAAD